MSRKRKKNSSQGFTLVEVLVAITILAIVVVPFLNSIYMAARTNAKAKLLMDATTAAQNVFEELKGEKLEDFCNTHSATKEQLKDGLGNPKLDAQGKEMYRYILPETTTPANYRFMVDQRTFLARVTVDPVNYTTVQGEAAKSSDYNSQLFAKISKLSPASNAFYIENQSDGMDLAAAQDLSLGVDQASIQNAMDQMSKTITVDIDYVTATKQCQVAVTVVYSTLSGATYTAHNRTEIYNNNKALSNELSNIFLCFLPMYSRNSTKVAPKEKIIINNPTNYPVNVYMVKQTSLDDMADSLYKSNYSVELEVNEGSHTWSKPITRVTTNLKYVEGNELASELTKVTYTGVMGQPASMKDALDLSEDLSRPEASIHIYKVKVEIFSGDDTNYAEALTTMEGTKIE